MKIFGLYEQYPRRYGKSRKIVYSKKDFLNLANRDNGFMDVFLSIYAYSHLKEIKGEYKIDSSSAIMDKLFMDMDFKDWDSENQLYERIIKLEKILKEREILRVWSFSGGGFHLYIYIANKPDNKKYFYRNAVDYISKLVCNDNETYKDEDGNEKKRRLYDPHCPPKLSQMARVIGTYNPRRHKFCISLKEDDFLDDLDKIKERSKIQNQKINYLGRKLMSFPESFDVSGVLESCSALLEIDVEQNYSKNIEELLKSLGILMKEIPPCIKQFLKENLKLNYTERYFLITFLYRCGLNEKEIKEVLKLVLDKEKLYHCCGVIKDGFRPSGIQRSRIETQIPDIIENDYYISCQQVSNYGLCNPLCKLKDVLYYFS